MIKMVNDNNGRLDVEAVLDAAVVGTLGHPLPTTTAGGGTPRRSRPTSYFPDAATTPAAKTAGKPSPTSRSTGHSRPRGEISTKVHKHDERHWEVRRLKYGRD
jgi:hypothetical protein